MKEKSFKVNIIDSRVSKPKPSNKQAIIHGADVVSMARAMEINQGRNQLEMRRENNIVETRYLGYFCTFDHGSSLDC